MARKSDAEFGRAIRAAIRGQRIRPRRLYAPHDPDGYDESDRDYFDNNRELIVALLRALGGERRAEKRAERLEAKWRKAVSHG